MPKPLKQVPPTSSVASILDPSVGKRVTTPVTTTTAQPEQSRQAASATMTARQFSLTPRADRTVRLLIDAIAGGAGLELNQSELLRSLLLVAEQSLNVLPNVAAGAGLLKRPQNHRDRQDEQAEMESVVAGILADAIRASHDP